MPTRAMRETLESRESRSSMDQLLRASHEDDELEHDVTSSTCGSFLCARGKATCFQLLVAVLTLTACAAGFGRLGYVNGRGTIGDALAMKTSQAAASPSTTEDRPRPARAVPARRQHHAHAVKQPNANRNAKLHYVGRPPPTLSTELIGRGARLALSDDPQRRRQQQQEPNRKPAQQQQTERRPATRPVKELAGRGARFLLDPVPSGELRLRLERVGDGRTISVVESPLARDGGLGSDLQRPAASASRARNTTA